MVGFEGEPKGEPFSHVRLGSPCHFDQGDLDQEALVAWLQVIGRGQHGRLPAMLQQLTGLDHSRAVEEALNGFLRCTKARALFNDFECFIDERPDHWLSMWLLRNIDKIQILNIEGITLSRVSNYLIGVLNRNPYDFEQPGRG